MIRNALYSIFLHLTLFFLIYLGLNFKNYEDKTRIKEHPKVVVNFAVKVGNSDMIFNSKEPKPALQEVKPEEKKEEVKKEEKKEEKKPEKKKEKPKAKPKAKDKPKSKAKPKKPEETKKTINKADPKEKAPEKIEEKKEKKEEIIKEVKKEEPKEELEEVVEDDSVEDAIGSKDLETIDLSTREKFNIQSQIKRCYRKAIGDNENDSRVPVNVRILIEKDGTVDLDKIIIADIAKYDDPKEIDFHIAVDNVKQTLSFCSPLRNLPEDKYDIWKEVDLRFDEEITK